MQILQLFLIDVFIVYKDYLCMKNVITQFYLAYFEQKGRIRKITIFEKKHGLTPLEKCKLFDFFLIDVFIV